MSIPPALSALSNETSKLREPARHRIASHLYASRIEPEDRWRIAAYIRVLQLSQHASLEDVPEAERQKLTQQPTQTPGPPQ